MAHARHNPVCFRWKRLTKTTPMATKRAEKASELVQTEVFPWQKMVPTRINSQAIALQSMEQLHDHDEAYSEAQDLLNNWISNKLHLELEVEEDEDEDTVITSENNTFLAPLSPSLQHSNFHDLYSHLDQETEDCAVDNVLQELMELDVVDSGVVQDLMLDMERKKTRKNNALATGEIRRQLVRERQARRNAERLMQQERKLLEEKARRREQEEQRRRRQEERQQEELLQQEVVQMRKKMAEQRSLEQRARLMERQNKKMAILASPPPDLGPTAPKMLQVQEQRKLEQLRRLQVVESRVHMLNLRCLQNHFSRWYSVVLERRVQMGNAAALCDWRSQLTVWREWRSLVWAGRREREARSTEEELRSENRRCQVALESNRQRLLRRCLSAWRILVQAERSRQDLLNQQEETQHKMAALIIAATSGKLRSNNIQPSDPSPSLPTTTVPTETTPTQSQTGQLEAKTSVSAQPSPPAVPHAALPMQAWQGLRCQTPISAEKQQQRVDGAPRWCERKEDRYQKQQRTIVEQRLHLREQRQQIRQLLEEQRALTHRQKEQRLAEGKGQAQSPPLPCPEGQTPTEGPRCVPQVTKVAHSDPKTSLQPRPCALVTAMEERARQRHERKRELEERKRRKEEERQELLRMEEERREQEMLEEKKREAEKRREQRRQQREREIERLHKAEQEKLKFDRAVEHHQRALLLHRGLVPLKRLLEKSHTQNQLAQSHNRASLQRRCLLLWLQAARESVAEKEARAACMYQRMLLRRILRSWLKMKEHSVVQNMQAERFSRTRILHRTLMALQDHTASEKFAAWEKERRAKEHWLRCMVQRCLRAWRELPRLQREEREREERRDRLRRRVAEILPDFHRSPPAATWTSPPR